MVRVKQRFPRRWGARFGFLRTTSARARQFFLRRSRLRRRRGVRKRWMRPKGYGHGRRRPKRLPLRLKGGKRLGRSLNPYKSPARSAGFVQRKLMVWRPPGVTSGSYENFYNLNTQVQLPGEDASFFMFPGTAHSWSFKPSQIVDFKETCYQWREFRIAYVEVRLCVGERMRPSMAAQATAGDSRVDDRVDLTVVASPWSPVTTVAVRIHASLFAGNGY